MDDAINEIRAHARAALADYHTGIVNGGEPDYPTWAPGWLRLMDHLDTTQQTLAALREDYRDLEQKALSLTVDKAAATL